MDKGAEATQLFSTALESIVTKTNRTVSEALSRRIRRQCAALTEILGRAKTGFTPDTRDSIVEAHEKLLTILDTPSESVALLQRVHELVGKAVVQTGLPSATRNKLLACDRDVHSILLELSTAALPEKRSWLNGWWTAKTKTAIASLVIAILTSAAVRMGMAEPETVAAPKPEIRQGGEPR